MQAVAAKVPEEEATHPGEWPGIYACDARNLLDVYVLTARARLAALDGDLRQAQVILVMHLDPVTLAKPPDPPPYSWS